MNTCIFHSIITPTTRAVSVTDALRDGHLQHRLYFEKATPHPLLQAAEAFGTAISYALGVKNPER